MPTPPDEFDPLEATVAEIRAAVAAGRVTAEALVDRYLAELGDAAPHDSLAEVYATGGVEPSVAGRFEGSGILDADALDSNAAYLRRLRRREELTDEVLAAMADEDLDALLHPPSRIPPVEIPDRQPFAEMNCELAAHTGLPAIALPAGFTDDGLPVGVELLGRAFAEPRLVELGYGFESATDHRRPPERFGRLDAA